jgi:hypothetical protein
MSVANIVDIERNCPAKTQGMEKQYCLIVGKKKLTDDHYEGKPIIINSRRELELCLLILGEAASVRIDEEASTEHPELWEWLHGKTIAELIANLKWTYREAEEVSQFIVKIPLPSALMESHIQMSRDDPEPQLLPREYVHKIHQDCVLISNPFRYANMLYFNGFKKSPEFNIDHPSDHIEGLLLIEVVRQAGIASVHLSGVPLSCPIILANIVIRFSKFVESNIPYIIQAIPVVKPQGHVYMAFNLIQNDLSCAKGYISAIICRNRGSYEKVRKVQNE